MAIDVSRRTMIGTLAAAGAATACGPAIGQGTRSIKFTLSWLAQGTSAFLFAGRDKGFFKSRGIDLQISRGFGSLAAAQAIAAGQFDFGIVIGAPLILMITKGLALQSLGTLDYDAMMGVGVLAGSDIKTPKDLAGVKIGTVPASAESPFLPAFAQKVGVDPSKLEVVSVDAKVLERVLSDKEVAAITGVASSTLPVLLSRNEAVRWMLYSGVGIPTVGNNVVTTPAFAKDEGLCAAMMDGLMESVRFSLVNPDETAQLFFKAVPEAALNADGKKFIEIGMGLHRVAIAKPAPIEHGLGWGDAKVYEALTDLVMKYTAAPNAKRPNFDDWYTNKYAGKIKLTPDEWSKVTASAAPFAKYLS